MPPPPSRALLPTFRTNCPDWPHFARMDLDGSSFCPEYHPHPLLFTQQSHTPFGDMYAHKAPQLHPKTPLFLAWTSKWANWTTIWAKWDPSGQRVQKWTTFLEAGKKKLLIWAAWWALSKNCLEWNYFNSNLCWMQMYWSKFCVQKFWYFVPGLDIQLEPSKYKSVCRSSQIQVFQSTDMNLCLSG